MITILVLTFRRPKETKLCLESIKKNCLFPHQTYLLNNGDYDVDEMVSFYKDGLVDKLILSKVNNGGGNGTIELTNLTLTDYFLWIEADNEIAAIITENDILFWKSFLEDQQNNTKCIDLTGGICGRNIYSGRSFFINTNFYKSIKKDCNGIYGGPGIHCDVPYLEYYIQEEFKNKGYNVAQIPAIIDNGYSSVRENPDGSQYIHQPDRKGLKVLKYPTEKFSYPKWSDREWAKVLETKQWNDWDIPENEIIDSFIVSHWHK